ncbi:MAG: hypothetical protein ACRDKL_04340, partial [Solirubrobacteraceae bacterium]
MGLELAGAGGHPPDAGNRPAPLGRPIGRRAFASFAFASFGGPLALAALMAPATLGDARRAAGLVMIGALVVFCASLAVWLRFSRDVHGPGGLYAFVEAAAGRRIALAQAVAWGVAYLLYLIYTTVQIVYYLLPVAVPGVRGLQSALALLIPVAIAVLVLAGRGPALLALAVIAAAQVVLGLALDWVTLTHVSLPASSFAAGARTGPLAQAGAQTSLLYVCGSLPLFLGGELRDPARTIRRGLGGAFALTAVIVVAAVAPLAGAPGIAGT